MKEPLFKPGWNVPTESWKANKIITSAERKEAETRATARALVRVPQSPFM